MIRTDPLTATARHKTIDPFGDTKYPSMDEPTTNFVNVSCNIVQTIFIAITAIWAYRRFRKERVHASRIEFGLGCRFFSPQQSVAIAEFQIRVKNNGLMIHEFSSIRLRVRGIPRDQALEEWKGREPRLGFPIDVIHDVEVVYKRKFRCIFVEPGVEQVIPYAVRIPTRIRFIGVRVEFEYEQGRSHSTERVFEVPTSDAMIPHSRES